MGSRKLLVASIGLGTVSYVATATSCGGGIATGSRSSSSDDAGDDGPCYVCGISSSGIVGNLMIGPMLPVNECCDVLTKIIASRPASANDPLVAGDAGSTRLFVDTSGNCAAADAGSVVDCRWTLVPDAAGTVSAVDAGVPGSFSATYWCGATPSTDTLNIDCTGPSLDDDASCPSVSRHLSTNLTCVSPPCTPDAGSDAAACDQ